MVVDTPMRGRGEIGRRSGLKIRFSNESAGSSPAVRTISIAAALTLASCITPPRQGPLPVSVIGEQFDDVDPDRGALGLPDAVLAQATKPGLVRFDASGQVTPALAENWITTADGLSTIFRLQRRLWNDGSALTGREVATRFNAAISERSRNALRPVLTSIDSVVGMTDRVVEIRLRAPRPNLLELLAQPELGVVRRGEGLGAWRAERSSSRRVRLSAVAPNASLPAGASGGGIDLRAERASLAIARFNAGSVDLVLGGTIADWPVVRSAGIRATRLRFDAARGLLGIAMVGRGAFLAQPANRQALAMAVDRPALATMLAMPAWEIREQLLPEQLDSGRAPARPAWTTIAPSDRRDEARRQVAEWARANGAPPTLLIAMPEGPGWRLVFARLAADWRAIGVTLDRASPGATADLRVIDAVAPNASANWFLSVTACEAALVCDAAGDTALEASRRAPTLAERSRAIASADDAAAARGSFIVLGAPIRWVLVDPSLTRFRTNVMAVHPLDQLRAAR